MIPLQNMIAIPKIIGVVCTIFIVIAGAYFFITSDTSDAPIEEHSQAEVVDVASNTENTGEIVPEKGEVTDVRDVTLDSVPEASKPSSTLTPAPTPATKTGYTLAEVAQHSNASSCYIAVNDRVYDLTSFLKTHPGGAANILKICGRDGTFLFENQHEGDSKPEAKLASFYLGDLVK